MLKFSKNIYLQVLNRFCSTTTPAFVAPQSLPLSRQNGIKGNFIESVSKFKQEMSFLDNELDRLDEQRQKNYQKILVTRKPLINLVEKHLCVPEKSKLILVGSCATGMICSTNFDIDLCFFTQDEQFYNDIHHNNDFKYYFFDHLKILIDELGSLDTRLEVESVKLILNMLVPLIIVNFKGGFSMDIQMPLQNFQAIRNSNLIKHYLAADSRFPKVFFYIKRLFECLGLRNSKGGLLSSYHLMMLTIHFLQCKTLIPPVLPVLSSTHPFRVAPDIEIKQVLGLLDGSLGDCNLEWKSKNTKTASELIVEMIDYYQNFDVYGSIIHINRGIVTKNRTKRNRDESMLDLRDPYSNISVCRSPHVPDAFKTAINFIHRKMRTGMLLKSFPHFPEAAYFRNHAEWKPWFDKLKCI